MNYALIGVNDMERFSIEAFMGQIKEKFKYVFNYEDAFYIIQSGYQNCHSYADSNIDGVISSSCYNFDKKLFVKSYPSVDCIGKIDDMKNCFGIGMYAIGCYIFSNRSKLNGKYLEWADYISAQDGDRPICIIVLSGD